MQLGPGLFHFFGSIVLKTHDVLYNPIVNQYLFLLGGFGRMPSAYKSKRFRPRPTSTPRSKSVNGIRKKRWRQSWIGPSSFVPTNLDFKLGLSCLGPDDCSSFQNLHPHDRPEHLRAYIKSAIAYCKKPGNERLVKPLGFNTCKSWIHVKLPRFSSYFRFAFLIDIPGQYTSYYTFPVT